MRRFSVAVVTVLAIVGLLALNVTEAQAPRQVIRVRGSDSMAGRIDSMAKLYMNNHPDLNIVVSGGAKGVGLEGLMEKSGEVAMAARKLNEKEMRAAQESGLTLDERLVGYGGVVIVTDPANTVSELTVEQVKGILSGAISRWTQVGGADQPIAVFSVDQAHTGTLTFMTHDFLGDKPMATTAVSLSSFGSVMRKVAETKGSIGFTRYRDAFESPVSEQVQVKVIKIRRTADSPAVMPSRQAIADGSYPIRRPFYIYLDKQAAQTIKEFVEFVAGKGWGKQTL